MIFVLKKDVKRIERLMKDPQPKFHLIWNKVQRLDDNWLSKYLVFMKLKVQSNGSTKVGMLVITDLSF